MTSPTEPNPSELIRWMEVPRQPQVFALGNFARQVTFASQQTRAFNLIWALFRANRLAEGQRVAVIGAGLAGMTAVAAALAKGCHVDLYEQASQPCPLQRGNDIRFVHPNILRWPEEGSERASTDFPFLNWTASSVRGVIKQIDLQWKQYVTNNPRLNQFFNYRVNRLYVSPSKSGPQRPWISANRVVDGNAVGDETSDGTTPGYREAAYDCIILAVGFGEERSVVGVPFLSYWENDSLHQETGRGRRSILVSGCGDGGLIDALRLRLRNFDHAEFVREFLNVAGSRQLVEALKDVDRQLLRQATSPDISLQFQASYNKIEIPKDVEEYFCNHRRADTTVTLNSPAPGPLSFRASLLNRYATYLAMRYADLHYLSGRILAERTESGEYEVTLQRDDIDLRENRQFDLIIVRHGPESVIRRLIPEPAMAELEAWWLKNEDITTQPQWQVDDQGKTHQFFALQTEPLATDEDVLDLALATFDSAYREFKRDPEVQSVAVGKHDGKAGFVVTLAPGAAPRQPRLYTANVLVQYVTPSIHRTTPVGPLKKSSRPTATPDARLLPIGVGIYNYDIQGRATQNPVDDRGRTTVTANVEPHAGRPDPYPSSLGTLGCFATDTEGNIYLLSASHVLSVDNTAKIGDRIFVEGDSPDNGAAPVAKLTHFTGGMLGQMDNLGITAARLEPNIQPDYDPLPPNWGLVRVGRADLGDRVTKVGRTSGVTFGHVVDANASFPINTNAERTVFDDCIVIVSEEGPNFSLPGDSGAVIVKEDGTAVGLLIARFKGGGGQAGGTVASSLEPALQALNLSLLTTSEVKGNPPPNTSSKRSGTRSERNK